MYVPRYKLLRSGTYITKNNKLSLGTASATPMDQSPPAPVLPPATLPTPFDLILFISFIARYKAGLIILEL